MEDQAIYTPRRRKQAVAPRIYISGRISGLTPEEVRVKFNRAHEQLVQTCPGWHVVNPLTLHQAEEQEWIDYMATDIAELLKCEAIYMLPDWAQSRGARLEYTIARELGIIVIFE